MTAEGSPQKSARATFRCPCDSVRHRAAVAICSGGHVNWGMTLSTAAEFYVTAYHTGADISLPQVLSAVGSRPAMADTNLEWLISFITICRHEGTRGCRPHATTRIGQVPSRNDPERNPDF